MGGAVRTMTVSEGDGWLQRAEDWRGARAGKAGDSRRVLRRHGTGAEARFWELVRDRRFDRLNFRRQYAIVGFVLDFYCPELRLAVEVDGSIHDGQTEADQTRDGILNAHNITVFRIKNEQTESDPEATLELLRKRIGQIRIAPSPSPGDGEGEGG